MSLYESIAAFQPFNEQEATDKEVILHALKSGPALLRPQRTGAHDLFDMDR